MNAQLALDPTAGLHTPMEWGVAIHSIVLIDIVLARGVILASPFATNPSLDRN